MPMSSPMMTTMLGFCGCCAVAGTPTAIEAATIESEPRNLFKGSIRHTPCQRSSSATADPRLDFVAIYFALLWCHLKLLFRADRVNIDAAALPLQLSRCNARWIVQEMGQRRRRWHAIGNVPAFSGLTKATRRCVARGTTLISETSESPRN